MAKLILRAGRRRRAALLAAVFAAAGCDPTCRLTLVVSVADADGQPVSGVTVTDVGQCNPGVECVKVTGSDGRATFTRTTLGGEEGQIRVEKGGLDTVTEAYGFDDCGTYEIRITLRP